MDIKSKIIQIGRFTSTHGIKGELKLFLLDNIKLLKNLSNLNCFIEVNQSFDVYQIEKHYLKNAKDIIKIKDFNNINEVLKYAKSNVYVLKENNLVEEIKTLNNFEVYQNNEVFGKVIDTMHNGVYELILVKSENREIWVPSVDEYVIKIDWNSNTIECKNLERLV